MNSGVIGKIEKAHRYAQEPDRVAISSLKATFNGDNNSYNLMLTDGSWNCDCHTHQTFGNCQHVMALEQMLGTMLPESARNTSPVGVRREDTTEAAI